MKRIQYRHSDHDRICCQSLPGKLVLSYQPAGVSRRDWLAELPYNPSVYRLFRRQGRWVDGAFSLTLRQLYQVRRRDNHKLNKLLERLPGLVDYVLRESAPDAPPAGQFCRRAARRRARAGDSPAPGRPGIPSQSLSLPLFGT